MGHFISFVSVLGLDANGVSRQTRSMFRYKAPCKINLSLRVLGKREDGFHEVDTLMAPLDLADELVFEPSSGGIVLRCDVPGVPVDESNLVVRAARIMERALGRSLDWTITLNKNVPHGAGLGGGSSDAASTLMALNRLENADMSDDRLVELAGELGSDVGFFILRSVCRCTGRGEIVREALLPEREFSSPVLLLKPSFGVSTPDAYKRWKTSAYLPGVPYDPVVWNGVEFVNDLERPVFSKFLFLAEMKRWMKERSGVFVAMMSGSGSTMFAMVESVERGLEIADEAKRELDPTLWAWSGCCGAGCVLDSE